MELEQPRSTTELNESIPSALDGRVLGLVVVVAALAASLNLAYGGLPVALVAFVTLSLAGIAGHVLGERKLRRLTDRLASRWHSNGGRIERISRSANGMRTEWTLHTPDGPITVGGLALVPISRLSIEWQGITDSMPVSEAEQEFESLADGLYREIFELR